MNSTLHRDSKNRASATDI